MGTMMGNLPERLDSRRACDLMQRADAALADAARLIAEGRALVAEARSTLDHLCGPDRERKDDQPRPACRRAAGPTASTEGPPAPAVSPPPGCAHDKPAAQHSRPLHIIRAGEFSDG
jgi:hypothetical protein